ncbi:MAG: transcription-repair coupling factor, partial [Paramuribaculum sp.]|nr:transcription-repair coupling factor [Paramuribaculum sp.]
MKIREIVESMRESARGKALSSALNGGDRLISVCNLAGSSAAVMLALLPERKIPTVVIGDSLDDAGYLYHDLCRIVGEEHVAMLPSGYKRHIKYGQVDPPSQILRTEALTRWTSDENLRFVVTYPEGLAERVADRDSITSHTLTLSAGIPADMTQTVKWLRSNGFSEVDYVYEPGQFAVRGSILDIFGYSHELPYRIDFFGDDIDSMRTFNVETQLSEQRMETISITSDVASQGRGSSLLDFIDPSTLIAVRDSLYTLSRISEVASESFSVSAAEASEGDASAMRQLIDAEEFRMKFDSFRRIEFTAAAQPLPEASASVDFACSPQALYHKNFDLISESFGRFLSDGYRIYILSDSVKQIERLRAIFADRGDRIDFTPVDSTLHEGFVDNVARLCFFTDHQIFDR